MGKNWLQLQTTAKSPTNAQMTKERRNRKHIQITNEAMRIRQETQCLILNGITRNLSFSNLNHRHIF
jgi:hypothetical protein